MNMRPVFSEPSEILAQYDALAARVNDGQPVDLREALAAASALALALRASLMTTTALAPRPKRAKAALAFDMGAQSFARALRIVMRACAARSTIPIFAAVRLDASGDALRLTCNDADREISVVVEAPGVGEWSAVVNGKALAAIVGKAKGPLVLRGEETEPREKGGHVWRDTILHISGAASATLQGLCVADWPKSPAPASADALPLKPDELRALLAFAALSVSEEETRYYLNGVFLHVMGGQLVTVATDGHRLHCARMGGWDGLEFPAVIIPRNAVADMLALLATPGEAFAFAVGAQGVTMTMGPVSLASKVIDGSFPDYTRVIPSGPAAQSVEMAAADLDSAMAQVVALRGRASPIGVFDFAPEGVTVSASTTEGAKMRADLDARGCGEPVKMAFNAAYVRDVVAALGAERVAIHIFGHNDPVRIVAAGEGAAAGRVAVIMPLRA